MNVETDNERFHRWWLAATALLLASLPLPAIAAAADGVGRVLSVRGDVTAVRDGEHRRTLARGDDIFEGDEITTGPNGRTQVRFIDQGLTSLSPATIFAVDEYRFDEGGEDGGGSIVMSLLGGAMRTATGTTGDRDSYRMNTATATIGVYGTGYALQYCDAACAAGFGGQPGRYGRVDEGSIRIDTPGGSAEFGSGDYFFVAEGGVPEAILQPPAGILDGEEDEGNGNGGGGGGNGNGNGEVEIIPLAENEDDDLFVSDAGTHETDFESGDEGLGNDESKDETVPAFPIETIAAGVALTGLNAGGGGVELRESYGEGDDNFETDDQGRVIGATLLDPDVPLYESQILVDGAQLLDVDAIHDLGVGWGRWEGEFLDDDGDPVSGYMAFTVTDNLTDPVTLAELGGAFSYEFAGGPSASSREFPGVPDGDAALWSVDEFTLGVDFGISSVMFEVLSVSEIGGAERILEMNGDGATIDIVGNGFDSGFIEDIDNSTEGSVKGQFVGVDADGMLMVFHITDGNRVQISGTSVLEQAGAIDSFDSP